MELLRLKYTLGKADFEDALEEKRKDLKAKVQHMKAKTKSVENEEDSKWEETKEELSEAYDNFKKAIKGLFS